MGVIGKDEAETLKNLILEKAKAEGTGPSDAIGQAPGEVGHAPSTDSLERFMSYRFAEPLETNARKGPRYGWAFTLISVATITLGLVSSALAGSGPDETAEMVIVVLGVLVGVLTGINQLARPGQRSVARYQAAHTMRREGWDYVHDSGRYRLLDPSERLVTFIEEIARINRIVEAMDEVASERQQA
jgi:Protein of unknown function (DUF4231)